MWAVYGRGLIDSWCFNETFKHHFRLVRSGQCLLIEEAGLLRENQRKKKIRQHYFDLRGTGTRLRKKS